MKKILLTGGNGFFCTRFKKHYEHQFDILSTDVQDMDITKGEEVMSKIRAFNPDIVIHAGAVASTEFCDANPDVAHKINVEGAVNVAKACSEIGAELVFISTEQVFNGNQEAGPFNEESIPVPNTNYGRNKLEAEGEIRKHHDKIWVLRFTWLFGLPENGCGMSPNIMWDTVKSAVKLENIKASDREFRGMTYSKWMVEQFYKVFELPYGLYHVGSTNDESRYDTVKNVLEGMGLSTERLVLDTEKYKDKPRDVRLCTKKVQSFGFDFKTTREGVVTCINDFKFKF